MRGQQEWRDRNTERKVGNLAKFQVVQRKEKIGRIRRKRKVTGLEETKEESKGKKTGQKRRKRRVQRRPEKGSISSFPSRSAILDPSNLRRKGQGGWNRFSVGERLNARAIIEQIVICSQFQKEANEAWTSGPPQINKFEHLYRQKSGDEHRFLLYQQVHGAAQFPQSGIFFPGNYAGKLPGDAKFLRKYMCRRWALSLSWTNPAPPADLCDLCKCWTTQALAEVCT